MDDMILKAPSHEDVEKLAAELGFSLRAEERDTFYDMLSGNLELMKLFDAEIADIEQPEHEHEPRQHD